MLFVGLMSFIVLGTLLAVSFRSDQLNKPVLQEWSWLQQHASRVVTLFGWEMSGEDEIVLPDGIVSGRFDDEVMRQLLSLDMPMYWWMAPDILLVQFCSPYARYCQEFYQAWLDRQYLDLFGPSFGLLSLPYPLVRSSQERVLLQTMLCRGTQESPLQWRSWYRALMSTYVIRWDNEAILSLWEDILWPDIFWCDRLQWSLALNQNIAFIDTLYPVWQLPLHMLINTQTQAYSIVPWLFDLSIMRRIIDQLKGL
jgi:hypothetical protein